MWANLWGPGSGFKGVALAARVASRGNRESTANVFPVMAVNPDPKPGRWILPLVILAMIAFTYFFVRELPEAPTDTTLAAPTTTTPDSGEETTTTQPGVIDPEVQAYLDQAAEIDDELQALRTALVAANTGFDAEPRTVQYREAVAEFEAVETATAALAARFEGLTPPEALTPNHAVLLTEIGFAANAVADALAGLTSDDPGVIRRGGVEAYENAADNFASEVGILQTAAADT